MVRASRLSSRNVEDNIDSRLEFVAEPGQSITKEIQVANPGKKNITLFDYSESYTINREGVHTFIPELNKKPVSSAQNWITTNLKEFSLKPNQIQKVKVTVNVPADANLKSYEAVLFFEEKLPGEKPKNIGLQTNSRIGVIILVQIGKEGINREGFLGDLKVKVDWGKLIEFKPKFKINWQYIFVPKEVRATTLFVNNGNVFITLDNGSTTFTPKWQKMGKEDEVPLFRITALPRSERVLEALWEKPPFLGPATATSKVIFTSPVAPPQLEDDFWIIPWRLIILIILILIIIFRRQLWKLIRGIVNHIREQRHLTHARSKTKRIIDFNHGREQKPAGPVRHIPINTPEKTERVKPPRPPRHFIQN